MSCSKAVDRVNLVSVEYGADLMVNSDSPIVRFHRREQVSAFVDDVEIEVFGGDNSGVLIW